MTYDNLNNNFKKAQLKKAQLKKAFSLIELSVVVLIIGILIAGITAGSRLVRNSKLASAAQFTKSSDVNSIPDLVLWLEPTIENSFATTSSNTDTLTYANVAGLQDSAYVKDTLRPDNREYVARWNDITPRAVAGNKKSVYQETGSRRPMYIANAINGLPALQFDGSSQYLYSLNNNTTPSAPPLVAGDDSYTMIAVFSAQPYTTGSPTIFSQAPNNLSASTTASLSIRNASPVLSFDSFATATDSDISIKTSTHYIAIMKLEDSAITSSNNLSFYVNNSSSNKTFSTSTYNIGSDAFFMSVFGNVNGNSYYDYFKGYIGEVLVFDRALKNEELDTIMKYLSKKWGIALK